MAGKCRLGLKIMHLSRISIFQLCHLILCGFALANCNFATAGTSQSAASLEQEQVCLVSGPNLIRLTVEVATTPSQKKHGLMGRESLPESSGMLFTYSNLQSPHQGFWMFNTLIPLDIAYLDHSGKILAIKSMPPCSSKAYNCPVYRAGVKYMAALEVNQGYFQRYGIQVGDRVLRSNKPGCSAP